MNKRVLGGIILFLIVTLSIMPIVFSAESKTQTITQIKQHTSSTPPNKTSKTKNKNQEGGFFGQVTRLLRPSGNAGIGVMVVMLAIMLVILLYLWHLIPGLVGGKPAKEVAWAKNVKLNPPRGYDFTTYVVDNVEKTVEKDYYVKISESLYMSTNVTKPTFLYVPEHTDTYLCREGRNVVPCGLAYREGLLAILIDPKIASTHELAKASGLIGIEDEELDKLLSELYKKGETKVQEIPISPDTRIAVHFNIKNMIKSYLTILRSADEMMIHFLHTASQSESIEKFMKTAIRMQETKLSWLRWIGYLILVAALAIGMVAILTG